MIEYLFKLFFGPNPHYCQEGGVCWYFIGMLERIIKNGKYEVVKDTREWRLGTIAHWYNDEVVIVDLENGKVGPIYCSFLNFNKNKPEIVDVRGL